MTDWDHTPRSSPAMNRHVPASLVWLLLGCCLRSADCWVEVPRIPHPTHTRRPAVAPSLARACAVPAGASRSSEATPLSVAPSPSTSDEERPRSLGFIVGYLWPARHAWRAQLRVALSLLLLVVAKLFIVRVPFIFKRAIEALPGGLPVGTAGVSPTGALLPPSLLGPAAWMFVYGLSRAIYTLLQEGRYVLFTPVGQSALRCFMHDAFAHVQSLETLWLGTQSTGKLSRVFARGMRGMNTLLRLLIFNVLPTALEASLAIAILGRRYGGPFLWTSLTTVVCFVAWSLLVVQRRVRLLGRLNENDNELFATFFNALLCTEAVRVNVNEEHEVRRYDALLEGGQRLATADVNTISVLNAGQASIYWAGLGAMMALCARRVAAGALTVGDAVAINGLILQLHQPLTALGFTYQEIRQSLTDMRQLLALLRRRATVVSLPNAKVMPPGGSGAVRFESVSFGYTEEGNLRGVSFELLPGTKTAIVGSSGSGKSTVLKLILRLIDPDEGAVYIDGEDVRQVSLGSLRRQIALIPQDTILFADSVFNTIRYGDLDADEGAVMQAAYRVGLGASNSGGGAEAKAVSRNLRARVGERGMARSGGERQRVAIARALLKQPTVVLQDEPTSALDSIRETEVQSVLNTAFNNMTTLVVAHKLRSVIDADQALVMEAGAIVERGTHYSLLCDANSIYARMWARQEGSTDGLDPDALPEYCELLPLDASLRDAQDALSISAAQQAGISQPWLW